jgi:metal-responsive CopG/Arc/MetJ family transcriptional regulator
MYYQGEMMSTTKVAITIDRDLLDHLDRLVRCRKFTNRSRAIQEAVSEKLAHMESGRLARECSKLSAKFEQAMADEGLSAEASEWPEY